MNFNNITKTLVRFPSVLVRRCGSSGSKVPILPDSTTVHYPPYTTVCCIVVASYSLHVEVHPSF